MFAQGGTLLVPSRQRAAAVRLAWAGENLRAGRRSWDTPKVLTRSAWLTQQLASARQVDGLLPRLLTNTEEWVLWQRAAANLADHGAVMLSEDALARALRASAQLVSDYGIASSALDATAAFDLELSWLRAAMRDVERQAAKLQALPLHLALQAAPNVPSPTPLRSIGLDPLPAAWKALLSRSGAAAIAETPAASDAQVCRVAAADAGAELRHAAQWCRDRLEQTPQARLLVVIPDLAQVRDAVTQLWRDALCAGSALGSDAQNDAFVLEGGEPLNAYPWIVQALSSVAVLSKPVPVAQAVDWLLSPFWGAAMRAARVALAAELRASHFQPVRMHQLIALSEVGADAPDSAGELRAALERAVAQMPTSRQTPREFAQVYAQTIKQLGCLGGDADSALAQQLGQRWQELLEDFAGAARASGAITAAGAAGLLAQLARQASFAPASGDPQVTITASLEHPVVSYDGIWVARCNATAWPPAAAPDAFLPRSLQLQSGVREASATGQLQIAVERLAAWRSCTADLRLSWARFIDDTEAEPSALLQPFSGSRPAEEPRDALRLLRAASAATQPFADDVGPSWPAAQRLPQGSRSITLQSDCAFRAFAELRLGARAPELAEPGVGRMQRGLLLHKSLEIFWKLTVDLAGLRSLGPAAREARIVDAVAQAGASLRQGIRYRADKAAAQVDETDWQREEARMRRQLERLCILELQRAPFRVVMTEQAIDTCIAGASLGLRLDRVDAFEDGALALIDYKSSNLPQASRWLAARPGPVQLLVYLAALSGGGGDAARATGHGAQVAALATLHIGRKAPRFHGVSDEPGRLVDVTRVPGSRSWQGEAAAADWLTQQGVWLGRVEALVRQFVAGEAMPNPQDPATCAHCPLTAVCRRVERVRYDASAESDNADDEAAS